MIDTGLLQQIALEAMEMRQRAEQARMYPANEIIILATWVELLAKMLVRK